MKAPHWRAPLFAREDRHPSGSEDALSAILSRRRAGKSVRRFATRSDGEVIEPLGLGNFEAAKGADEITRKVTLGILLQHEMTVVGVFYTCHRLTVPRRCCFIRPGEPSIPLYCHLVGLLSGPPPIGL